MAKIVGNSRLGDVQLIERLEFLLRMRLPEDYRQFLIDNNGGYPVPDGFYLADQSEASIVDKFLGVDSKQKSNIFEYLKIYEGRYPKEFFPIAHDPGGNLILIGVSGDVRGQVFFWDHETEVDDALPDRSNIRKISNSFDEFLDALVEIEE